MSTKGLRKGCQASYRITKRRQQWVLDMFKNGPAFTITTTSSCKAMIAASTECWRGSGGGRMESGSAREGVRVLEIDGAKCFNILTPLYCRFFSV